MKFVLIRTSKYQHGISMYRNSLGPGPCWLEPSESASWRQLGSIPGRGHSIKYPGILNKELFCIM
jgi:hypothetical protein